MNRTNVTQPQIVSHSVVVVVVVVVICRCTVPVNQLGFASVVVVIINVVVVIGKRSNGGFPSAAEPFGRRPRQSIVIGPASALTPQLGPILEIVGLVTAAAAALVRPAEIETRRR